MKFASAFQSFARFLTIAVFATAVAVRAEQKSFTTSLTEEEKTAAGLPRLTNEQLQALEAQVQHEITTARQGDTVAFSTSFTHRRSPQQRKDAGLDRLMTPELTRLDSLIAAAVANRPSPISPSAGTAAASSSSANSVQIIKPKMEVHGELTLSYMSGSGGRSGYGASMVTTVIDPSHTFAFTVGLSQFRGKGLFYPGEYECDRGW